MPINTVVRTFEDNNERILWLPSITLAYLFTLSGNTLQFGLAIASIGGAQWFRLLMNSDFASSQSMESPTSWFRERFSYTKLMPLAVFSFIYPAATIYAIRELYRQFTHQDIVVVGLGAIWWGIAMVVLINTLAVAAKTDSGEPTG